MAWGKTIKEHCSIMFYSVLFFPGVLFALSLFFQDGKMDCVWQVRKCPESSLIWIWYKSRSGSRIKILVYFVCLFCKRDTDSHWKKKNIDLNLCCFIPLFLIFLSFHGPLSSKCQRCFWWLLTIPWRALQSHRLKHKLSMWVDNCAVNLSLPWSSIIWSHFCKDVVAWKAM